MHNVELAEVALQAVKMNPEEHVQTAWRCDSGMCYAGWTGVVDGARWVISTLSTHAQAALGFVYLDHLTPKTQAEAIRFREECYQNNFSAALVSWRTAGDILQSYSEISHLIPDPSLQVMHVADYAEFRLGLTREEANVMFAGSRSVDELEIGVKAMANGEDVPTAVYA